MNAQLAKCKCQHCNQKIEFNADDANQTVACPNCGMETLLFIPPVAPRPIPGKRDDEYSVDKKNVAIIFSIIGLMSLIGFVVVVSDPEVKEEVSAPVFLILSILGGILYFAPALVGSKKRQFPALFALNLLLGWTFIGWVAALVWALVKEKA